MKYSGADLGFFVLQSRKKFIQGVVSAGRGGRQEWLNNFNADSLRAHQHAQAVQRTILELVLLTWTTLIKASKSRLVVKAPAPTFTPLLQS